MKMFPIITVGISIIENFKQASKVENRPPSDNEFWNKKLDDINFLNEL